MSGGGAVVVAGWCSFFSSRRRRTRLQGDWSSDVCSSDLLELIQGRLELLDAFLQFSLMLLVMADRRFRQGLSEAHILLQFLKALPLCMLFADLAIQFSPRRVEHGHSSRNFFGSVLHKSI